MAETPRPFGHEINRRTALGIGEVFMYWLKTELSEIITIEVVSDNDDYAKVFQPPPEKASEAFRSPMLDWGDASLE